ncbi:hypothetical protein AKO1_013460 [Acrasis kona]|uniref:Uncharacterized protein n=1 Tax=Acrasis kona TaxID=1008807 RepID=A0AAW2ZHQ6_9EUKA
MKTFSSLYDHEYDHIIERRQRRENERVNLNTIKQAIDRKLATPQKSRLYWSSLTLFLKAKLTKTEWDHIIKVSLGPDFGPLHNYFLRCLFFNARSTHVIPVKEVVKPVHHIVYKKSDSKRNLIQRNRISSESTVNLEPISVDTLSAGNSFPDRDIISNRMNKIAVDVGLIVSSDSVVVAQRGLEQHLKNIIEKIIKNKAKNTNEHVMKSKSEGPQPGSFLTSQSCLNIPNVVHSYVHYVDDIPYMKNVDSTGVPYDQEDDEEYAEQVDEFKYSITPRDVLTASHCCPNLIRSEKMRESILLSNWDLYN